MARYQVLCLSQLINDEEVQVDPQDQLVADFFTDEEPIANLNKLSIKDLVIKQDLLKQCIDDLGAITKALNKKYDTLRLVVLPTKMDEDEIPNITIDGDTRKLSAYLQQDLYFSIPAETKDDSYEWLKTHGHEDLVQETVNSSSGKAWAKEMIKVHQRELEKRIMALVDGGMSMEEANDKIQEIELELIEEGKAIPPDIFKVTPFTRAQITRKVKK